MVVQMYIIPKAQSCHIVAFAKLTIGLHFVWKCRESDRRRSGSRESSDIHIRIYNTFTLSSRLSFYQHQKIRRTDVSHKSCSFRAPSSRWASREFNVSLQNWWLSVVAAAAAAGCWCFPPHTLHWAGWTTLFPAFGFAPIANGRLTLGNEFMGNSNGFGFVFSLL